MNILYLSLVYTVWFISTYFVVLYLLIFAKKRSNFHTDKSFKGVKPMVSVILPAFNEECTIGDSIKSLLNSDYPQDKLEIILINDGSEDGTLDTMREYEGSRIRVLNNRFNKGKACCLNQAIEAAQGEYVACMDSDSIISPDAIDKTLGFFKDKNIGAVTIQVDVKKPKSILERIIEVEYAIGLSLSLKALSYVNSIHVTPGPFSIYRRRVLEEIGGFDEESITEDLEIAYRMQERGYKIESSLSTRVYTTVPKDLRSLYRQRIRWYSGALQTLIKYKRLVFNKNFGNFGMFFLPFNYSLVILGLLVFIASTYMMASDVFTQVSYLGLVGYDLSHLLNIKEIDPLAVSIFYVLACSSIAASLLLILVSFRIIEKNIKENITGCLGYLLFFVLYQVFWLGSLYNLVFKKKVKWR